MGLKTLSILFAAGLILVSCAEEEMSDAYGQFEAIETTISAEASGRILNLDISEGDKLEAGVMVGLIDTTQLALKRDELQASMASVQTNIAQLDAEQDVLRSQLETAENELARLESLRQENAATQRQIDNSAGQVNTLNRQIAAVETRKQSVNAELETLRIRIEQAEDQLRRAAIINPVEGTVLGKFAEAHERVSTGSPVYRIANLDELILRVYVSGARLPQVRINEEVEVLIDENARENQPLQGTVSWVSSRAEFTPRMIQTKEERVTQVYAVKVRVRNPEGVIKIGMPGEVNFR